ncbi:MAG: IS1595 family transposase [Rhodospirillaceae bacterium]|nr:IS1595 family transposase [Rhodospirillaceae bacterium]
MAQNAPGKHHRKGISLFEIMRRFPDDATAEAWFIEQRWPDGAHCPHCGSVNVQHPIKHRSMTHRCREKECAKRFSVRTGSVMADSNLGYRVWAVAFYLVATNLKGVSSMKLHRDLEITQKTAWHLAHRIREGLIGDGVTFAGPVEVDECYIGGKRRNMSNAKRKGLTGRGAVGKTPVAGVKDRETNRVSAKAVSNTDGATLQGFVRDRTAPGATVYTDDARAYRGMKGFKHEAVNHSAGEYVRAMAHTNGIESFWASVKRRFHGTFHHFSVKHMDRYIGEAAGQHNLREADTIDIMAHMARGIIGRRLRYADLIAD